MPATDLFTRLLGSVLLATAALTGCAEDGDDRLPRLSAPDEPLAEVETALAARVGGCVITSPPSFGGVASGIASDSLRDGVTNIVVTLTGEDTALLGNVVVDRFDGYRFDGEPAVLSLTSTPEGATAHADVVDLGFLDAAPMRLLDAEVALTFGDSPQVVESVQVTGALTFENANRVYLDIVGMPLGDFIYGDGQGENLDLDTDGDSVPDAWHYSITLSDTAPVAVVTR